MREYRERLGVDTNRKKANPMERGSSEKWNDESEFVSPWRKDLTAARSQNLKAALSQNLPVSARKLDYSGDEDADKSSDRHGEQSKFRWVQSTKPIQL